MSTIEHAQEGMEKAHHAAEHQGDRSARFIAVLIAILAAALAICETAEKGAQNEYLTKHIALSNDWAFYQAKNGRATVKQSEATILGSLPNALEPQQQQLIARAKADEARLRDEPGGDGMRQLSTRAQLATGERDRAFHRYHVFEYVVGALQIAIVLASVAIVTRIAILALAAAIIGAIASGFGLFVALT